MLSQNSWEEVRLRHLMDLSVMDDAALMDWTELKMNKKKKKLRKHTKPHQTLTFPNSL
jgi:hypothetical protein